ncbi:PREDICTED: receptor like protein 30-like [Ipomoea nil]|uniref:receptor like protein 30-like n=1 Tax=Ipomoea nil TaxID=35883 RepID=UPI0009017386|nr:PREDICTED: receptor like protein 30-like [Ipomoea nil]
MHVSAGQCFRGEKTVLLQIRTQLTYKSSASTKLVQWDERIDCCRWPGVSCNDAGYISGLHLSNEPITGGANLSLLQKLPSLSVIRLDGINFSAPFPDFFADFTNLTVLSLESCNFTGTVPQKVFQVPTLQTINLDFNEMLEGSFPNFPENGSLQSLTLYKTKFSGDLPESIGNLRLLSQIDITSCDFSGAIPASFIQLTKLVVLNMNENSFSGPIPESLFFLPSLENLDLSRNKFSGQISDLQKMMTSPLALVDLSGNNLEGLVVETSIQAEELPLLPQFLYLKLASCKLDKFPNFLKNQSKLINLDISSNDISGEIPGWIWGFNSTTPPKAEYLDLSNNKFSMIPFDIADQIPHVYFFSIEKNRVSGRIPSSWCHAANLEVLDLSNNALHGTIPSCLVHNNTNLTVMNLKGNHLSGEIPQKFLPTCSFVTLDLSQNLLEGQLPPSLVNCTKLKVLNLGNNIISDTFPCWLNKLSKLHILILRSNRFDGSISCPEHGVNNNSWPSLQVIDISSNNFNGNLPTDLFLELKAILVDDRNEANSTVDYLHFTSPTLGSVYYQDSVSLSLKGQGYTIYKILSIFTSIDFSSNQFEGGIPEIVGELKLLYLLNVSHNALTGNIPPSLENLKSLEALDLSFNSLTGNIPEQLESLTFLSSLNLSYNNLVGRIPQGKQFNTFDSSSFMGNKGLCGFQLNVSCNRIHKPASSLPKSEEKESAYHGDINASVAVGFVVGLGGIFLPLLLSNKWRLYYNKKIDGVLLKVFFQRGKGRRKNSP